MPREVRRAAGVLTVLLVSVLARAAEDPPPKPVSPPPAPQSRESQAEPLESEIISGALCGENNREQTRAKALDAGEIPQEWRASKVADVEIWLKAPRCRTNVPIELERYERRRKMLRRIQSKLEEAPGGPQLDAEMKEARTWKLISIVWPTPCTSCVELEKAAKQASTTAREWFDLRPRQQDPVGVRLGRIEKRRRLLLDLCAARPGQQARKDFTTKFAYYSWTTAGKMLLTAADWFERSQAAKGCPGP